MSMGPKRLVEDISPYSILGSIPKEKRHELYLRAADSEEACGQPANDCRKDAPKRDISLFETRCVQLKAKHWSIKLIAQHLKSTEQNVNRALEFVANVRAAKGASGA